VVNFKKIPFNLIGIEPEREEEKGSTADYQMPALKMMTNRMKSTKANAAVRPPPYPAQVTPTPPP
jgi:hypothetical protein